MIIIDNISDTITGKELFEGISVTLFPTSLLEIRGGNGRGKTTFLNIIGAKLEQPLYLSHERSLDELLLVEDQLLVWARIYCGELALSSAVRCFGLEELLEQRVKDLSAGEKQRVALSRLLLSPANHWLLDEPFSNLDEVFQDKLRGVIEAKIDCHGIVIYTNHENLHQGMKRAMIMNIEDFRVAI